MRLGEGQEETHCLRGIECSSECTAEYRVEKKNMSGEAIVVAKA